MLDRLRRCESHAGPDVATMMQLALRLLLQCAAATALLGATAGRVVGAVEIVQVVPAIQASATSLVAWAATIYAVDATDSRDRRLLDALFGGLVALAAAPSNFTG